MADGTNFGSHCGEANAGCGNGRVQAQAAGLVDGREAGRARSLVRQGSALLWREVCSLLASGGGTGWARRWTGCGREGGSTLQTEARLRYVLRPVACECLCRDAVMDRKSGSQSGEEWQRAEAEEGCGCDSCA